MTFIPEHRTLYAGAWSAALLGQVDEDTDSQQLAILVEDAVVTGLLLGWLIQEGSSYRVPVIAELDKRESDPSNDACVFDADWGEKLSRSGGYRDVKVSTDLMHLRNTLRDAAWREADAQIRRLRRAASAAS